MNTFVQGTISSAGFAAGHRFVIGCWQRSPVGPLVDVMAVDPDGTRVLHVPTDEAAAFITLIYAFDQARTTNRPRRRRVFRATTAPLDRLGPGSYSLPKPIVKQRTEVE